MAAEQPSNEDKRLMANWERLSPDEKNRLSRQYPEHVGWAISDASTRADVRQNSARDAYNRAHGNILLEQERDALIIRQERNGTRPEQTGYYNPFHNDDFQMH